MNMKIKQSFALIGMLFCISCHRPQQEGSTVSIQIPSAAQFAKRMKQENLAASTIDYTKLCFGVNVKGPGISASPASSCDIERGVFEGQSVAHGGEIVIQVPVGDNREFEVYGFLRNSASDQCPDIVPGWNWPTNKIYFLGSKSGVSVSPPTTDVSISITLPDEYHNLAIARGWPNSCGGAPQIVKGFSGKVLVGSKRLSSTNFRMKAHISEKQQEPVLTGSSGVTFRGGVR